MAQSEFPSGNGQSGGLERWFTDRLRWFRALDKRFQIAAAAGWLFSWPASPS